MTVKCKIRWFICLAAVILFAGSAASAEENLNSLSIIPERIPIGIFYDGAKIQVSANVPACDAAVMVLEGGNEEVSLNRKGRVAFIWMNVAHLTLRGLPKAYIMAATDKIDNICCKETQGKLQLGMEYLKPRMVIQSDQPLTGTEFTQFLKLKTQDGTYDTDNRIDLKPTLTGRVELTSVLNIPSKVPPGIYDIRLDCFRDGKMVVEKIGRLRIERVGLAQFLRNLANEHAALYGLLAIAIAMAIGIFIGFIFSALPGREH